MQALPPLSSGRHSWLIAVPVATALLLLWLDVFNLRGLFFGAPDLPVQDGSAAFLGSASLNTSSVDESGPRGEPTTSAPPTPAVAAIGVEFLPLELDGATCRPPSVVPRPSAESLRRGRPPKVALSMALHSRKFHSAGTWLQQYSSCPGAVAHLAVIIVFTDEEEMSLFKQALGCAFPDVPSDAWTGIVAYTPAVGWGWAVGTQNQIIAAYKKWFGIVHMMDMTEDPPEYGLMVDSELLVYDNHGKNGLRGSDCVAEGPWSRFYSRVKAFDDSRSFPAARVSPTLVTYSFGGGTRSGADYDKYLIEENAHWVGYTSYCGTRTPRPVGCDEVQRQIDLVLFSWWTDVPWMNLQVTARMLKDLFGEIAPGGYRQKATGIVFPRFEYLSYQQWCVLHEGFTFRDVTDITGEAKWGSYMEDPLPGARLAELKPIWFSGEAMERLEQGVLPRLSAEDPPLIIFHADKGKSRANREANRDLWRSAMKESVRMYGKERGWDSISQEDW